jgi:nucleoside-diphosphate-sugar epimerase
VAGESFNIANERPVTQEELVRALARAAGQEPRLAYVPRERIEAAGGSVTGPEKLYFGEYLDLPPITQTTEKSRRLLGFSATPFDAALEQSYAWYREQHRRRPVDYRFEDALLAA